jgi:methylene-tetrahydromethanopterin dehydrogenase
MLSAAKQALVPPFGIWFFADLWSFTTAAAMVACIEKLLHDKKAGSLRVPASRYLVQPASSGSPAAVIAAR